MQLDAEFSLENILRIKKMYKTVCENTSEELPSNGKVLVDIDDLAYIFNQSVIQENYRDFAKESEIKHKYLKRDSFGKYLKETK
jgi:Ca2+-binding EF-hand superfamily protein